MAVRPVCVAADHVESNYAQATYGVRIANRCVEDGWERVTADERGGDTDS